MKERGILFNGDMVRAVLDGRKTKIRRIIKPQPIWVAEPNVPFNTSDADPKGIINCPFGVVGDRLWVRETFALEHRVNYGQKPPFDDGRPIKYDEYTWMQPHYRATDPTPELDYEDGDGPKVKWTPSARMPRWASRINLEITGVRVERLQDISEEDAKAEGSDPLLVPPDGGSMPHVEGFCADWELIYGAGSWDKNPFVWVIEFRRV